MLDIQSLIANLKRPQLLVRAARFGVDDYSREKHLRRVLGAETTPRTGLAIMRLLDIEREMNEGRLQGLAAYSIAKHVDVLIAIMGESRTLRAISRPIEVTSA